MRALDEPLGPGAPSPPGGPGTQSSTGLLERTEVEREKAPGDGDRFAHFVRRDKADASMVTGQPVVALCGKVWIPTRDASRYPVCPTCKALRDGMGKNGRNWPFSDGSGSSGFGGGAGSGSGSGASGSGGGAPSGHHGGTAS